mgnify:CR=1 FL=1
MFRALFLTVNHIGRDRKAHRTGHRAQRLREEETAGQCIMYYRRCIIGDMPHWKRLQDNV